MTIGQFRTVVFEITDPTQARAFLGPMIDSMGESVDIASGVRVMVAA